MRSFCLLLFLILSCSAASNDYLLGSGDQIEITVYGEPDLTTKVTISKSGIISFPFINDFPVLGLTTKEIENVVYKGLLGDYLIEPQVSVSVTQYRPFFIHGQVKRPGGYPYQEQLTLDKAIAIAGGLASRASKTNWKISRIEQGKNIVLEANVATKIKPDDIIKIEQSFF